MTMDRYSKLRDATSKLGNVLFHPTGTKLSKAVCREALFLRKAAEYKCFAESQVLLEQAVNAPPGPVNPEPGHPAAPSEAEGAPGSGVQDEPRRAPSPRVPAEAMEVDEPSAATPAGGAAEEGRTAAGEGEAGPAEAPADAEEDRVDERILAAEAEWWVLHLPFPPVPLPAPIKQSTSIYAASGRGRPWSSGRRHLPTCGHVSPTGSSGSGSFRVRLRCLRQAGMGGGASNPGPLPTADKLERLRALKAQLFQQMGDALAEEREAKRREELMSNAEEGELVTLADPTPTGGSGAVAPSSTPLGALPPPHVHLPPHNQAAGPENSMGEWHVDGTRWPRAAV